MRKFASLLLPIMLATAPIGGAAAEGRYATETVAATPVADAYFNAYVGLDWDRLEPLLADDATFSDPTATLVFGGVVAEGKAAMMQKFRTAYASLRKMSFKTQRTIHSGNFALYEGDLLWTVDMGDGRDVSSATPMVIVIEVKDGKVVSHRDYVDYAPFLTAERANRPAKK